MSFSRRLLPALALLPIVAVACGDDDANPNPNPGTPDSGVVDSGGGSDGGSDADAQTPGGNDVKIPGLTGPVTAAYDANGFLHVSGKTDNDAFATVGYFHAANRFFFMDFLRNAVRGTLGQKIPLGDLLLQDVTARTFFADPKTGDPLADVVYASLDDGNKAILQAYTAGVNAWIADMRANRNGAKLSEEYGFFSNTISDWIPSDSVAILLYFLNDLSNPAQQEIQLGQVAAKLPGLIAGPNADPALAGTLQALFFDFRSTYDVNAVDSSLAPDARAPAMKTKAKAKMKRGLASSDLEKALAMASGNVKRIPGTSMHREPGDTGSNNWVISGTRTTSGRPIVANDPHLSILNPSLWFPVEVDGKTGGTGTYHAAGGSFPGLPTVQTGHNESIAWGVTVAYWDLADAYIETVAEPPGANAAAPGKVTFNGGSVEMIAKDVTFMKQGQPVTQTLRWVPHHGPVVGESGSNLVTIRWRGHDGTTDMNAFVGLGRANTLAEAKTALESVTSANQNFVIADKAGDIGYFPFAKVPARTWAAADQTATTAAPFYPLDGRGAFEWGPPVAVGDIPQTTNPSGGFVATANGDINGAFRVNALAPQWTKGAQNQPLPIQTWAHAEGTRQQRIVESLRQTGNANTIETSTALQGDTKSLPAVTIVPALLAAAAATAEGGFSAAAPGTAAAIAALTAWSTADQFTCPSGVDGLDPAGVKTANADVARESVGCAAFHVALYALFDGAFGDELAKAGLSSSATYTNQEIKVLVKALQNPATAASAGYWADSRVQGRTTTMNEILQRSLTKAGEVLTAAYGATTDDWRWGRFHVGLQASLIPTAQLGFNGAPYPLPGGLFTVNVANPSGVTLAESTPASLATQFRASSGPSIRTQIEVGADRPRMKLVYPGGADGHRTGRFYNNLLPQYLANTPVDFPFGADLTNPVQSFTVTAAATP